MTNLTTENETAAPRSNGAAWTPEQPMRMLTNQCEKWTNFRDPISFDDAAQLIMEASAADGAKEDVGIASIKSYMVGPRREDGVASLVTVPIPGRAHQEFPLRKHAFAQLCSRVGAPSDYIRKLPTKLQMVNLNHGLQSVNDDKGNLVRLAGGEARAILSQGERGYSVVDNEQVVDILRSTLQAQGLLGAARVRSLAVGKTCSLRLTFPEHDSIVQHSRQVNDIVEVGLDVLNGEIGNRGISISPMTWRLVCLNGMRRADKTGAISLRHVGDPKRLAESFRDAVPVAIAAGNGMFERMGRAVESMLDSVLDEFDSLKAFGLTSTESRDVARDVMATRSVALPSDTKEWGDMLAEVRDVSVYDVLNGVTHVAQQKGTDRRIEMEEAASKYLFRRVAA
jgi:hypothetical protein